MDFLVPSNLPPIPTYRVMNSSGVLEDESRPRPDVEDAQVITWYKNMVTGASSLGSLSSRKSSLRGKPLLVNIMDTIMSEAQRQGRISFYMVGSYKAAERI
jgi:2-oxoisovalerate dehydrogenase E1 component alpha subunit